MNKRNKEMESFGTSKKPRYLIGDKYIPMGQVYWGPAPLPSGAEIVGGYSDKTRLGALIKLRNGRYVCGNAGCISNIQQL